MTYRKNKNRHSSASSPVRPFRLWQDKGGNEEVKIELIPLIDVIFCILTFFILAAVNFSRQQAISLDLPQANTGTPQMREMLVVSLDDLGQVYVEQQLVSRTQLSQSIKNYQQSNPTGLMVLYAAKNATYREVVEILDILREVGGDRVALAPLPKDDRSPNNTPTTIPLQPNPSNPSLPNNFNPYNIPTPPNPPSQ